MKSILIKNYGTNQSENNLTRQLKIENGIIRSFESIEKEADEIIDLKNELQLFAGFIDVHIHGAVGVDTNEATTEEFYKMAKFMAENGVTAWLPTFVPDSDENYERGISAIEELIKIQENEPIAQVVGVHYEGIFANEKMCGALRPQYFKTLKNGDELKQIPRLQRGAHLTTLAPEVENGIETVQKLVEENWIVSIGHTKAEIAVLDKAFEAGAKHLTHFFNAMTGLHHRDVGVVGWALTNENVTFDIIADGIHVHPKMLEFAVKTKTADKVSLISDSVLPTGLGDGDFHIWGENISVHNNKTQNERGSIAGSVITMLDAVKMMLKLGFSPADVSKMASLNPAKLLGIEKDYGSIEVGKRADLVALDAEGNVKLTIIGGKVAYSDL
ncbi:MAG TPA: N-acetylglucosamine-6-phosphate deacetylase [Pyrinomonadaceae bacterium]|nr:N-acetylglucosamine-6-phosphate deacetylase [Pyrinomonadaceae bacterium]